MPTVLLFGHLVMAPRWRPGLSGWTMGEAFGAGFCGFSLLMCSLMNRVERRFRAPNLNAAVTQVLATASGPIADCFPAWLIGETFC